MTGASTFFTVSESFGKTLEFKLRGTTIGITKQRVGYHFFLRCN